jgi:type IV pilus assembly protein PilQ
MPSLLKFAILATCAACGIGVAVALGLNQAPAKDPASQEHAPSVDVPAATREPVSAKPAEPPEASSQILATALDQVKQVVQQQGQSFEQAISAMAERMTPPAAPLPPQFAIDPLSRAQFTSTTQPPAPETLPPARESLPSGSGDRISRGDGDDSITLNIQNSDIRAVLDMLSEQGNFNILASNSVQGNVTASLRNVDISTALAAILKSTGFVARREGDIIFVGKPADIMQMDQTVDQIMTRVYRPNYVTAA